MEESYKTAEEPLTRFINRSDELQEALVCLLENAEFDSSSRGRVSLGMCTLSLEHASGVRVLMASGCPSSAVGLVRLQFEATTRAIWLLYVAGDDAVMKLISPLTIESEEASKSLPTATQMIDQIGRQVGIRVPKAAHQMLCGFRDASWSAMNSFVHSGIHPLSRHTNGYPLPLVLQILKNSNALSTMAGMTLALLTQDIDIVRAMSKIQYRFDDCLLDLLK